MSHLTERMRNWLEGTGAHIGTASLAGVPTVIVVAKAETTASTVRFHLSPSQSAQIAENITANPQVAFGPGGLGSIRAAYQFKGLAQLKDEVLEVQVQEIYCTKPGPEAGLRLDNLAQESVERFEQTRWRDNGPPR